MPTADPDPQTLFREWKEEVRNVLTASHTGVEVRALDRQFDELMGKKIPVGAMGFQCVGDFLYQCSDVFEVYHYPHEDPLFYLQPRFFLFVKASAVNDEDLYELVTGQRVNSKSFPVRADGTTNHPLRCQVVRCDPIVLKGLGRRDGASSNPAPTPSFLTNGTGGGGGLYNRPQPGRPLLQHPTQPLVPVQYYQGPVVVVHPGTSNQPPLLCPLFPLTPQQNFQAPLLPTPPPLLSIPSFSPYQPFQGSPASNRNSESSGRFRGPQFDDSLVGEDEIDFVPGVNPIGDQTLPSVPVIKRETSASAPNPFVQTKSNSQRVVDKPVPLMSLSVNPVPSPENLQQPHPQTPVAGISEQTRVTFSNFAPITSTLGVTVPRPLTASSVRQAHVSLQGHNSNLPSEELKRILLSQFESYFSPDSLSKDKYLATQMDKDHYVPIATLASFKKVKDLTSDIDLITEVLKGSKYLQVHSDGKRVRPLNFTRTVEILRGFGIRASASTETVPGSIHAQTKGDPVQVVNQLSKALAPAAPIFTPSTLSRAEAEPKSEPTHSKPLLQVRQVQQEAATVLPIPVTTVSARLQSVSNSDRAPPKLGVEEIRRMLISLQLESYFTFKLDYLPEVNNCIPTHLLDQDRLPDIKYLVTRMDRDHYVPIATLAIFNKVKALTSDIDLLTDVLKGSKKLQVHSDGRRVRPIIPRTVEILRGFAASNSVKGDEGIQPSNATGSIPVQDQLALAKGDSVQVVNQPSRGPVPAATMSSASVLSRSEPEAKAKSGPAAPATVVPKPVPNPVSVPPPQTPVAVIPQRTQVPAPNSKTSVAPTLGMRITPRPRSSFESDSDSDSDSDTQSVRHPGMERIKRVMATILPDKSDSKLFFNRKKSLNPADTPKPSVNPFLLNQNQIRANIPLAISAIPNSPLNLRRENQENILRSKLTEVTKVSVKERVLSISIDESEPDPRPHSPAEPNKVLHPVPDDGSSLNVKTTPNAPLQISRRVQGQGRGRMIHPIITGRSSASSDSDSDVAIPNGINVM